MSIYLFTFNFYVYSIQADRYLKKSSQYDKNDDKLNNLFHSEIKFPTGCWASILRVQQSVEKRFFHSSHKKYNENYNIAFTLYESYLNCDVCVKCSVL